MEAHTFVGCLLLSNNTAELSAVPHAMADMIVWKHKRTQAGTAPRPHDSVGVIMVYDSQYTKDMCTTSKPPTQGRQIKNATAIATCRRLLQAATDRRFIVRWVKVKGHSGDEATMQRTNERRGRRTAEQRTNATSTASWHTCASMGS